MAAQLPDRILLNGEQLNLYSNPLEQYWIRLDKKRPNFNPLPDCKRGYIALWEIRDNELFLREIDGNYERRSIFFGAESTRFTLKDLFPKADRKFIKATWFSGKLRIPRGKMRLYDHQDYNSRFEKETIVTIDKGDMTKMVTLDYSKSVLVVNSD